MLLFASAGALGQSLKNYKGEIVYKEQPKNDVKATSYKYEDKNGTLYILPVKINSSFIRSHRKQESIINIIFRKNIKKNLEKVTVINLGVIHSSVRENR